MKSKTKWVDFREIKEKVKMEEILDRHGLLKDLKRKENELVGYCPIHNEEHYNKNAFCANVSKNNWHCFSCGAGGNVLDFVVAMENVNIREAGLRIQKWSGIVSRKHRQIAKEEKRAEKDSLLIFTLLLL